MTSETLQDKTEHQTPKDILVEMMNTLPPQMEYNYLMNDSLMLNQQQQSIPSTAQPLLQQTNPMLQQQVISNHQQMITPTQPVLQNSMQPLQNQLQQTGMQNQLQQSNIQTGLQPAQIQTSIQNFENPVYENQQVNQLQSVQLPIQQNLQQPIQSPLSTSLPPSSLQPPILPSVQQGIIQTQVIAQPVMQMQPNMMPMQQNLGISILPDQFTILEEKSTEAKLEEALQKLSQVKSTMDTQQKLVHDTIGHYVDAKKAFDIKEQELKDKITSLNETLEQKNKEIERLNTTLQETVKQLDKVNAYVANNVVQQAGNDYQISFANSFQMMLQYNSGQPEIQQPLLKTEPQVQNPQKDEEPANKKPKLEFSPQEKAHLLELAAQDTDWERIARILEKTPYECHDVYLGLKKPKKGKWSTAEDALLLQTFTKLSQEFPNDLSLTFWNKVATQMMVLRTGSQCMARYQETLDPTLKRGKWSEDEVELLLKLYQTHGKAWVKISEQIPGRTQRQCRARWIMTQKKAQKLQEGKKCETPEQEDDEDEDYSSIEDESPANDIEF